MWILLLPEKRYEVGHSTFYEAVLFYVGKVTTQ